MVWLGIKRSASLTSTHPCSRLFWSYSGVNTSTHTQERKTRSFRRQKKQSIHSVEVLHKLFLWGDMETVTTKWKCTSDSSRNQPWSFQPSAEPRLFVRKGYLLGVHCTYVHHSYSSHYFIWIAIFPLFLPPDLFFFSLLKVCLLTALQLLYL